MTTFKKALQIVTGYEGGFSNHKSDPGGKTMFGITEQVARDWGYEGKMRNLPKSTQKQIARDRYWKPIGGRKIAAISEAVAVELFEIGFNVGTGRAVRWLQSWLNAFNRNEKDWPNIKVDGIFGPNTEEALVQYCSRRKEENLVRALNGQQIMYYKTLAQQDPKTYAPFLNGWIAQRGNANDSLNL